jgi:integrase
VSPETERPTILAIVGRLKTRMSLSLYIAAGRPRRFAHVQQMSARQNVDEVVDIRREYRRFLSDLSQASRVVKEISVPRFSRNTLRLVACSLRALMNAAVEDGLIEVNPASKVGRFTKSEKPARQASAITRDEAEQFLTSAKELNPDLYPLFLMALRAGLRKGELIAVTWGDVPNNLVHYHFQPCLEHAGLRRFRFHDLRHTFGSLLIQDGASLTYVKNQMGYGSIQVTANTYGHLIPGADINWIDGLDRKTNQQQNATPTQPEVVDDQPESLEVIEKSGERGRNRIRVTT